MVAKHYWDSVCFLAWLQNEAGRIDACRDTLDRASAGEIVIVTSALTVAEVLWTKAGPRLTEEKAGLLNGFFRRSYIKVVNLDRAVAQKAQKHVWNDGIRPKDSIHLATALHLQCDVLETYDDGLLTKNGQFDALTIGRPQCKAQGSLDLRS
ncbi:MULTISPECIES: type II toxin-antitoxin system VapC family toxin [Rhizobium]|uniref:type II toxin-antitoxin system VapC family toxin n=1 Tax=Rhizobium leguminosarum TaxID=384 RepID=UPI00124F6E46|nr:PIN domain-containing protein [Rhizobium sp. PEPV16]NKM97166.1 PIN domain-containing protein [Rhizobium leguminosarum bv. viciae]